MPQRRDLAISAACGDGIFIFCLSQCFQNPTTGTRVELVAGGGLSKHFAACLSFPSIPSAREPGPAGGRSGVPFRVNADGTHRTRGETGDKRIATECAKGGSKWPKA